MKSVIATVAVSTLVATSSSDAFTITTNEAVVASSTRLFNFSPTKWTPQGGAKPANSQQPAAADPYTPSEPSNDALSFGGMPQPAVNAAPKSNYAPTKWSPQGGAVASQTSPSSAAAEPYVPSEPSNDALNFGGMPQPVANVAPKSNYAPSKWSPQGGAVASQPHAQPISADPATVQSNTLSFGGMPQPVANAAPKSSYAPTKWSPKGSAAVSQPPANSATVADPYAPSEPSNNAMSFGGMPQPAANAAPKSSYAPTKWSPQGGSSAGGTTAPVVSAPPPSTNGAAALTAPASTTAPKSYSGVGWTPQGGANPRVFASGHP